MLHAKVTPNKHCPLTGCAFFGPLLLRTYGMYGNEYQATCCFRDALSKLSSSHNMSLVKDIKF